MTTVGEVALREATPRTQDHDAAVPIAPIAPSEPIAAVAAAPSLAGREQRDDIQGMRAVAMLMIAAYHVGVPLSGTFTGPDVFFTVSGFVITSMLLRERARTGRIAIIHFYVRRVRRLLPALAIVSVATLVLAALCLSPVGERQQVTGRAVRAATTLFANFYFLRETGGYFQPAAQENPFLHGWTLSVEEQFYLVFPLTLAALWWIGRRRRRSAWWGQSVLVLVFALSLGANIAFTYKWVPPWPWLAVRVATVDPVRLAFFSPLTRGWEFLSGVLLALVMWQRTPSARVRAWTAVAGAALLIYAIIYFENTDPYPGLLATVPVLGTLGLLIGGVGGSPSFVTRILSTRLMVWIGDRSYSWYLWHWPLIVVGRTLFVGIPWIPAAAAIAALVPAELSFRFVEEPIRRRQLWPSHRATVLIAVTCVAAPLVCAIGLTTAADRSWGDPHLAALHTMVAPNHIDITAICASFTPLGNSARATCRWPATPSRGTVLLIGDSNAGHFSEPFIAAANALGYDAQLATAGGCPFLLRPTYVSAPCRQFVEGSLLAIAQHTPSYAAIVVSNATTGYLNSLFAPQFAPDAPPPTPLTRAGAISGWVRSMGRTVETLSHSSPVIVVGAVPQFANVPACVQPRLFADPARDCGHWSAKMAASYRTDMITKERAVVLALGATYLDAGAIICDPSRGCSAFIDGTLAYRDGAHLSVAGSMHFEPALRAALVTAIHTRR